LIGKIPAPGLARFQPGSPSAQEAGNRKSSLPKFSPPQEFHPIDYNFSNFIPNMQEVSNEGFTDFCPNLLVDAFRRKINVFWLHRSNGAIPSDGKESERDEGRFPISQVKKGMSNIHKYTANKACFWPCYPINLRP
jgi:hypothetical protein